MVDLRKLKERIRITMLKLHCITFVALTTFISLHQVSFPTGSSLIDTIICKLYGTHFVTPTTYISLFEVGWLASAYVLLADGVQVEAVISCLARALVERVSHLDCWLWCCRSRSGCRRGRCRNSCCSYLKKES